MASLACILFFVYTISLSKITSSLILQESGDKNLGKKSRYELFPFN